MTLTYENLLYVCRTCNTTKSIHFVPGPCEAAFGKCLEVHEDGTITALNEDGELLIEILRLDNEDYNRFRRQIIRTVQSLGQHDREAFVLWMQYPEDMPDLSRLRPPGNTRPAGVNDSYFALRLRGELDETY